MKLLYFPFTYISESSKHDISSFLRRITAFQSDGTLLPASMKSLVESDFLEILTPVTGNENKLHELISSFKMWGSSFDDKNRTYFKTRKREVPFLNESSTSKIRAELTQIIKSRKGMLIEESKKKLRQDDILMWARMLLQLAQELDIETEEFQNGMQKYAEMEHRLFENMRCHLGEDSGESKSPSKESDSAASREDKLEERILAWSILLPYCKEEIGVLITDKKEVIEFLKEFSDLNDMAFQVGPVPAGHKDNAFYINLEETLISLARENDTDSETIHMNLPEFDNHHETFFLEVYVLKNTCASDYFNKGVFKPMPASENILNNKESMNTVICLIRRNK